MKAFLIDPFARTVTEVEYNGDYKQIYTLIDCSSFDVVRMDDGDGIYVDGEGLISGKPQEFFFLRGGHQPYAGKGLVLGSDSEGESVEPSISLSELRSLLTFPSNLEVMIRARSGQYD